MRYPTVLVLALSMLVPGCEKFDETPPGGAVEDLPKVSGSYNLEYYSVTVDDVLANPEAYRDRAIVVKGIPDSCSRPEWLYITLRGDSSDKHIILAGKRLDWKDTSDNRDLAAAEALVKAEIADGDSQAVEAYGKWMGDYLRLTKLVVEGRATDFYIVR